MINVLNKDYKTDVPFPSIAKTNTPKTENATSGKPKVAHPVSKQSPKLLHLSFHKEWQLRMYTLYCRFVFR